MLWRKICLQLIAVFVPDPQIQGEVDRTPLFVFSTQLYHVTYIHCNTQ